MELRKLCMPYIAFVYKMGWIIQSSLQFRCDTGLLWYCSTVTLFYCGVGCSAVRLFYCEAVLLWRCFAVRLFCCEVVLLWRCSTVRLFCCSTVRLSGCSAVRLFYQGSAGPLSEAAVYYHITLPRGTHMLDVTMAEGTLKDMWYFWHKVSSAVPCLI